MRFTQRQAAGKFTRDEAIAFIDQLERSGDSGDTPVSPPTARLTAQEQLVRRLPAEQLATELRRRGWMVSRSAPDPDRQVEGVAPEP